MHIFCISGSSFYSLLFEVLLPEFSHTLGNSCSRFFPPPTLSSIPPSLKVLYGIYSI